jgi:cold shock protein
VFVHISAVEQAGLADLPEGQRLKYDLEQGRNGKMSAAALSLA